MNPVIRKSGNDWIIDRGPHTTSPCFKSKEDAERLLRLSSRWEKKTVRFTFKGNEVEGKVVNTALLHTDDGVQDILAIRVNGSTYWVNLKNVKEV